MGINLDIVLLVIIFRCNFHGLQGLGPGKGGIDGKGKGQVGAGYPGR